MQNQSFVLTLDGVPYEIKATPFTFNESTRFNVTINGSDEYVFAYDENVSQYIPISDDSSTVPQNVETAISEKLFALAQ